MRFIIKEMKLLILILSKRIGYNILLVGTGKAINSGNMSQREPATIYVEGVKREIRSGAYVVPVNDGQQFPAVFTMRAADESVVGQIVSSANKVREFAKFDVVMINKGTADNVRSGDVLNVQRQSPQVVETSNGPEYVADTSRWNRLASNDVAGYKMPKETIGEIMVFRAFQDVSMALILNSEKPLRLLDGVVSPQ